MAPTSRDPYTILGVTKDATPADIAAAYRRLALRHHPDRGGDAKMFILVRVPDFLVTDTANIISRSAKLGLSS